MIETVACYIRVSTEEQKLHGISLDAQRDKLTEYAKNHDLKIVGWYEDEGVSGRKLIKKRPALQRMLIDAQAGKFQRIIFIKLDRFFRSVAEYHECMKLIDPVVWTATEEKYDLTTANGRAFVNMKLTIAELEADQTGERIRIVNEYKAKVGKPLTGSQRMSIGFTVSGTGDNKRVVKDKAYEPVVNDIIQHYLKYQSKRATTNYVVTKYPDLPLSYRRVTTLLSDTKLYGSYRGNDNYCEPYIDKDTYDKIQKIVATRGVKVTPTNRVYLFTGLIHCPCCGRILASNCSNQYHNEYVTYKCNKHFSSFTCDFNKTISEIYIENYLIDNFNELATNHINIISINNNECDDINSTVNAQIEATKKEMKNTTIAFTKDRLTEAEYDRAYSQLERKLKELNESLKPKITSDIKKYDELLQSTEWISLYKALNRQNKRVFWRKYINYIELDKDSKISHIELFD